MKENTLQQKLDAQGGMLPWQDAVRILLSVMEPLVARGDAEDVFRCVTPAVIELNEEGTAALTVGGEEHPLADWKAENSAEKDYLPWELQNQWARRFAAAQVYPLAVCLYRTIFGELPPTPEKRLEGEDLKKAADVGLELPERVEDVLQKGLTLSAADRWPNVETFRARLAAASQMEDGTVGAAAQSVGVRPIDLTKIHRVPVPKNAHEDVYQPTEKKTSHKSGFLIPVVVLAAAFAAGLVGYRAVSGNHAVQLTATSLSVSVAASSSKTTEEEASTSSASSSKPASSSTSSSSEASSSASVTLEPASSESASSAEASSEASSVSSSSASSTSSASSASSSTASSSSKASSTASSPSSSTASSSASSQKPASSSSSSASSGAASSSSTASSSASSKAENAQYTLTLEDGSKFVGTGTEQERTGTLTTTGGDVYTGTFVNGLLEGKGTLKTSAGTYSGNFVSGKPSGSGTMTYASGNVYSGNWAEGQRSGSGKMTFTNGDTFSGNWAADVRDGSGTYTWADGTTYSGTWKAGKCMNGGTYTYTDEGAAKILINGKPTMIETD